MNFNKLIGEGKIREVGLSNESAWGTAQFLKIAEDNNLPRMQSIQNEYSLLCRYFDLDLAELCHHEDVGLLAFSPLATGMLTGKYQNGQTPEGSRKTINDSLGGRVNDTAFEAITAYQGVAEKHNLDLTRMSLAFCMTRPFMASVIFGATTMQQLENSLKSAQLKLSDEVMADILNVYKAFPIPY